MCLRAYFKCKEYLGSLKVNIKRLNIPISLCDLLIYSAPSLELNINSFQVKSWHKKVVKHLIIKVRIR